MKRLLLLPVIMCFSLQLSAAEFTAEIDAAQKGTEISPFIYGQFIEHLGRCINGGIWAEMLEDRKFFYPAGSQESPWKPVYECKIRKADKPFTGTYAPESYTEETENERWLGVWQNEIAVRKGKKYNGYAWIKCSEGIQKAEVHFHWNPQKHEEHTAFGQSVKTDNEFYKIEFVFEPEVDSDNVMLEIAAFGKGTFTVGCVSLMPSDNIQGLRKDTLECLKQLDSPLYRWPGGNFVSGYDWKDGIGSIDKRPPRKNPAWKGVEPNDFGINEFLAFCKILKTEPYIAVNTGNGDVDNAVAELEYVNGSIDTPMGKLRKEHGHTEPYNVIYWGIGNEMYGNWQIGHIPVEKYVEKHNSFVDSFRSKYPQVKVIGVGNVGKWDEEFLPGTAKHLDYISEHFYVGAEKDNVAEHIKQIPREVKRISDAHRKYRTTLPNFKDAAVPVVLDEWNYWHKTPQLFGELGIRYNVKDGLGIAAGLHEFFRQSDLYFMANYAQTVNVIGAIKTSKTNAKTETTGLALELYRKHFGRIPVKTKIAADSPLDVQAAVSGNVLTAGIINTLNEDIEVKLDIKNFDVSGKKLTKYEIADPQNDPNAFNDPDQPYRIEIKEKAEENFNGKVKVKPFSITLLKIM